VAQLADLADRAVSRTEEEENAAASCGHHDVGKAVLVDVSGRNCHERAPDTHRRALSDLAVPAHQEDRNAVRAAARRRDVVDPIAIEVRYSHALDPLRNARR